MSHAETPRSYRDAYITHRDAYFAHIDACVTHRDAYVTHRDVYVTHRNACFTHRDAHVTHKRRECHTNVTFRVKIHTCEREEAKFKCALDTLQHAATRCNTLQHAATHKRLRETK